MKSDFKDDETLAVQLDNGMSFYEAKPLLHRSLLRKLDELSVGEAAFYLHRKPQTLNNWRSQKIGPRYRLLHGRVIYKRIDLDEYILKHTKIVETK